MADVETPRELLIMALQDLHDGECEMEKRLRTVRGHSADENLRALLVRDATRATRQRDTLARILRGMRGDTGEEPNVWLRAILDDADNDAATIAHGPLRDMALVGAIRKGKQSQRVSYETALVRARQQGDGNAEAELQGMAESAAETDAALAKVLIRLGAVL